MKETDGTPTAAMLDTSPGHLGSPEADPNIHHPPPAVRSPLFGHANGALKGGVHLKAVGRPRRWPTSCLRALQKLWKWTT